MLDGFCEATEAWGINSRQNFAQLIPHTNCLGSGCLGGAAGGASCQPPHYSMTWQKQAHCLCKTRCATRVLIHWIQPSTNPEYLDQYEAFVFQFYRSEFALGAILFQLFKKERELDPVAWRSWSLIQPEQNYEIFDKESLGILSSSKEWTNYLEGNPNRLKVIVYTNNRKL